MDDEEDDMEDRADALSKREIAAMAGSKPVYKILNGFDNPDASYLDPMYMGPGGGENELLLPFRWWMMYDPTQKTYRKPSATNMAILKKYDNTTGRKYERYPCTTDTQCVQRFVFCNADALDKDMLRKLRTLALFFFYDPRKSSSSTFMVDLNMAIKQFWNTVEPLREDENRKKKIDEQTTILWRTQFVAEYQNKAQKNNQMSRSRNQYIVEYGDMASKVQKLFKPFDEAAGDLDTIIANSTASGVWQLAVGVICCIGCRFNEVFDPHVLFQEAEQIHREPDRWILQIGVSKDKESASMRFEVPEADFDEDDRSNKRSVEKPITFNMTTGKILSAIATVREYGKRYAAESSRTVGVEYDKIEKATFGGLFIQQVNRVVKAMFNVQAKAAKKKGAGGFGSHWCRALYANVAYATYKDAMPYFNQAAFIASVLAHSPDNLTTSINYSIINVRLPSGNDADPTNLLVLADVRARMLRLEQQLGVLLTADEVVAKKARGLAKIRIGRSKTFKMIPRLPKHGPIRGNNDRWNYVDAGIRLLQSHGLSTSRENLVRVGVSGGWVTAYRLQTEWPRLDIPKGNRDLAGRFVAQDDRIRSDEEARKQQDKAISSAVELGDLQDMQGDEDPLLRVKAAKQKYGVFDPAVLADTHMDEIVKLAAAYDKKLAKKGKMLELKKPSKPGASGKDEAVEVGDFEEVEFFPMSEEDSDEDMMAVDLEEEEEKGFEPDEVKEAPVEDDAAAKMPPPPPRPPAAAPSKKRKAPAPAKKKKVQWESFKRDKKGDIIPSSVKKQYDPKVPPKLDHLLADSADGKRKRQRVIEPAVKDDSTNKTKLKQRDRDRYSFDGFTSTKEQCEAEEGHKVEKERMFLVPSGDKTGKGKKSALKNPRDLCQESSLKTTNTEGNIPTVEEWKALVKKNQRGRRRR
jgi:hypothetical protein